MMAFDLGGPVNKVAYAFAVAGLGAGTATNVVPFEIMAAVMAAGMVPPLALALASTVLYRKGFTKPERENGKAAWLLGAVLHLRGRDPVRRGRPAARHPGVDGRRRGHGCDLDGRRRDLAGAARRHLRLLRHR